ncbi:hypothetical protein ACP70R_044584 [Stipagrostis hirtigluma subsp. patula]
MNHSAPPPLPSPAAEGATSDWSLVRQTATPLSRRGLLRSGVSSCPCECAARPAASLVGSATVE